MSKITGNVKDVKGAAGNRQVTFTPLSNPVVVGQAIIAPEAVTARADFAGYFEINLVYGDYQLTAGKASVKISVPDDDNTYNFSELITGALIQPALAPAGVNFRFFEGDLQFKNADTGLFHSASVVGAPGAEQWKINDGGLSLGGVGNFRVWRGNLQFRNFEYETWHTVEVVGGAGVEQWEIGAGI